MSEERRRSDATASRGAECLVGGSDGLRGSEGSEGGAGWAKVFVINKRKT